MKCISRYMLSNSFYNIIYLCPWIRCSGLPPCYPPGQRARVASPQLSWFRLLGRNKLYQLDKQSFCQLLPPFWTQGLLPLQYHSRRNMAYIGVATLICLICRVKRVKAYRGIEPINGVKQPGLLNPGPSWQNLWVIAGIPPCHIHHLLHTDIHKLSVASRREWISKQRRNRRGKLFYNPSNQIIWVAQ